MDECRGLGVDAPVLAVVRPADGGTDHVLVEDAGAAAGRP